MTTLDELTELLDKKQVKYSKQKLFWYLVDYGKEFCDLFMTDSKTRPEFYESAIRYKVRELYGLTEQLPTQKAKNKLYLRFPREGTKLVVREDYATIRKQQTPKLEEHSE